MNYSFWLIVIFVATVVCNTNSRPQDEYRKSYYRAYRRSKDLDEGHVNSTSVAAATQPFAMGAPNRTENEAKTRPDIEEIAIVARASNEHPPPGRVEQSPGAVGQMVESDIRTPPKLKEIIRGKVSGEGPRQASGAKDEKPETAERETVVDKIEANGRFELPDISERASSLPHIAAEGKAPPGKRKDEDATVRGVAVPVLMDDVEGESTPLKKLQKMPDISKPVKNEKKKNGNSKPPRDNPTTTPSSGLSTWILLSDNRDTTAGPPKKANKKEPPVKAEDKKTNTTAKKPVKIQMTTQKPGKEAPKTDVPKLAASTKKAAITYKPDTRNDSGNMSALEAMVKNQKKTSAFATAQQTGEDTSTATKAPLVRKPAADSKTKPSRINDRMDPAETRDKAEVELAEGRRPSTVTPTLPVATQNPATTVVIADQSGPGSTTTDPSSTESTTKKRKSGSKKKKKNKNRRRKPSNAEDTQIEQKNVAKNPKQPIGDQFYNFLSREIMPTVGLGLVGVLVTAGLAGLLGYNPFVSGSLPVRRTYEVQHGYSPHYYNYNADYGEGGQSEEALFREVLSGMPDGSRYSLTNTENSYPESQIYNSQDEVYDSMKIQADKVGEPNPYPYGKKETNYAEDSGGMDTYPQDYSSSYAATYDSQDVLKTKDSMERYPIYNREVSASYVYSEGGPGEKTSRLNDDMDGKRKHARPAESERYGSDKLSSKYSETIERQPEALYRVAGDYDSDYRVESTIHGTSNQNSWHRMGSAMDYRKFPQPEPGPRSLNFTKSEMLTESGAKKRSKRDAESVVQRIPRRRTSEGDGNDIENEIDFGEDESAGVGDKADVAGDKPETTTTEPATENPGDEPQLNATEADYDLIEAQPIPYNFLDVLKRLAQLKLKLGLSFLRSTTDAFSRYLDVIQKRVDESITNTTMVYRIRRNPGKVVSRSGRSVAAEKLLREKGSGKRLNENKKKAQDKKAWKKP